MKYYIIKPRSAYPDETIIKGILTADKSAKIVNTLDECDIAILQKGWTRSKIAVTEWKRQQFERRKPCHEGYLYRDKYKIHIN